MGGLRARKLTRGQKIFLSHDLNISPDNYLWVEGTPEYIIIERKDNQEREVYNRFTGERIQGYGYAG